MTEQAIAPADLPTLRIFNHKTPRGRVCVYQAIPPSGRITWCSRSELTGRWMPCGSPHPPKQVIHVPIDPTPPTPEPTEAP